MSGSVREDIRKVVVRPIISEKAFQLAQAHNQYTFQVLQDVLAIRDAIAGTLLNHVLHGFEQELLGQHDIGAIRLAEGAVRTGAHRSETLVCGYRPCVQRTSTALLAVILEERRPGGRLEAEVVHTLPIAGENARGRIKVR